MMEGGDYTIWMRSILRRHVKLLDILIDKIANIPSRPGFILDSDIRDLRFVAKAMGIELKDGMNLKDPDRFDELRAEVFNAILAEIDRLKPELLTTIKVNTQYGPIAHQNMAIQNQKGGEKK